jgi:DNA-binding beta-propeller fold protein YncE
MRHRFTPACAARATASALALLFLATGCATGSKAGKEEILFPPPPDTPRIKYVRSFRSEDEINNSWFRKFLQAIVPHDTSNTIFGPTALALSPDETKVYVALPHRSRVIAVDLVKKSFTAIGRSGKAPLGRPLGVATDNDGNIYVADKAANSIAVFDPGGALVSKFGRETLQDPSAIAVDRKNRLVYVVNDSLTREGRHSVEVFSLAGKHLRTMGGKRSPEAGSFNFPHSLAVSRAGELYVADMLNFRVQVFDSRGGIVRFFGTAGSGFPGQFDKIHSVSFDTFGNVYVADAMQGIHILNPDGQPLMLFGPPLTQGPTALVVDSKNHIYVADLLHALHEFQLVNTTAADSYPGRSGSAGGKAAPKAGAATTSPGSPAATPARATSAPAPR